MKADGRFTVAYTKQIIAWRWVVILGSLLMMLALGSGMSRLAFQQDFRIFFSDENPQLAAYNKLEATYSKVDDHQFMIKNPHGTIFEPTSLTAVNELTKAGWLIPYGTRVDSITNFQHSWSEDDDLNVEDLVPFDTPPTPETISRAKQVGMSEPLLYGSIVSLDGSATMIRIRLLIPRDVPEAVTLSAEYSRNLVIQMQEKYPSLEFHVSGSGLLSDAFGRAPLHDATTVYPAMLAVLTLCILIFTRSGPAAIATWGVVLLSTIGALGAAGYYGYGLNPVSAAAPVVIMTLAVADSFHIIISLYAEMRRGASKHDAIIESMRINAQPVFLTSVTTCIGFLVLNFSDAPPYNELGNITATGTAFAWLLSVTFLPSMLSVLPIRVPKDSVMFNGAMEWLAEFNIRHTHKLVVILTSLIVFAIISITHLEINDTPHHYFSKSSDFRISTESIESEFGFYDISLSVKASSSGGINDPKYLESLDLFAEWLRSQEGVVSVTAYSDIVKRLNRNMHGDDPDYYGIPSDRQLAAQYLLLYEMSLPYGLDLNDMIDVDKSATRIGVLTKDIGLSDIQALGIAAEEWLITNGVNATPEEATSASIMFSYITRNNIWSQLWGTLFGFTLIAVVLIISLRSVLIGVLSLIPNIVPALTSFGIWALIFGEVGFAISIVAGLSIGIIVDSTVHFLSKYVRARREKRLDGPEAVRYAFHTVGQALVSTAIIISAGFAVLALSSFRVTAYIGALTSMTIVCALVADFFLLPALLLLLDRKR